MKFRFKAIIYQVGINWCVDVPLEVTKELIADRGKMRIKGKINEFAFTKTLMPVKNAPHRLFVNQAMMKGGKTALGERATFVIEPNNEKPVIVYPIPALLAKKLSDTQLTKAFGDLTDSRRNEILKYLNYVKTEETLLRNIDKLLAQLRSRVKNVRIP